MIQVANTSMTRDFIELLTRSFGGTFDGLSEFQQHATLRVLIENNSVIAGGFELLARQFYGARAVPVGLLGFGCVAPEMRGRRLIEELVEARASALREQGAVATVMWTSMTGAARRGGFGMPSPVYDWKIPAESLRRLAHPEYVVSRGPSDGGRALISRLSRDSNGPIDRPDWWASWQLKRQSTDVYEFALPGREVVGSLRLRYRGEGEVTVYEFWFSRPSVMSAMLAFLGQFANRAAHIHFEPTSVPPSAPLFDAVEHAGDVVAVSRRGWALRIEDVAGAVAARGWRDSVSGSIPP